MKKTVRARGGWGMPGKEERARRNRAEEQWAERRHKALAVLATLKKSDAVVIVAGLFNRSRHDARAWLKEKEASDEQED